MTARLALAFPLAVALLLVGCGDVVRLGRLPDVSRLEAGLTPGVSTRQDVLRELGPARSGGAAMLPGWGEPRDVWLYDYEESGLSDSRRAAVYVFFDHDRFDGYLWFSSLSAVASP